ncbi:cytochrome P450 2B11 [Parasteatoda tepidariorum]|uniref:cytochrome P450 2B11 n=1 Tax=Parasteatoda tepidariorum TaxID=114398 RepID=UPI001C71FFB4|nr:cytochrome P450 2C15 [Parasteatoda tepidariorum]XP_042906029.1 cytochrome P450 2C15 [Parasteatoda tepidariorum]
MEILKEALFFASNTISSISIGVASASLILGYILAASFYYILRDYGVPPGPTGVPILGWWPFVVSEHSHLQQLELKKKYGDIFSFRITGALYINLASQKMLREAHITRSDNFRERTSGFNLLARIHESGVPFSRGEKWQTIRRYFLTQFRDRGMTLFKENTADTADETVLSLVEDLRKSSKEPSVDILNLLVDKSILMIRNTFFGFNTPVTVKDINVIQEEYRLVATLLHSKNMLLHGNFAKYFIFPCLPSFREAMKLHSKTKKRFQKMIDEHGRTFDEDNIRDIIDAYIHEKNERKSKGDDTYKYFTDETLVNSLLQFVGDGVVNVSTFVTFLLMSLLDHPEEQEKIYKELVEVCGEDRNPTVADKNKLRYFNAFLLEAQRMANFIPLFPSLVCTKETTVGGYRIPRGAITVTNAYAIHTDCKVYENPEVFNPSRFLGEDGKSRAETPVAFGVGKRVCLGEGFVLMQTFLYLAAIVKNFKITYQVPKNTFEVAMTRKLNVCVTPRK